MTDLNIVDIIAFAFVAISAVMSVVRGFTREFLGIVGWVGAFFAALYGLPYLRPHARMYIHNDLVADLLTGIGLFVVALIILSLFFRVFASAVQSSAMGSIDRSVGLLFGIARGWIVLCLIYLLSISLWSYDSWPQNMREAHIMQPLAKGAEWLKGLLPTDFTPKIDIPIEPEVDTNQLVNNLSELQPETPSQETIENVQEKAVEIQEDAVPSVEELSWGVEEVVN